MTRILVRAPNWIGDQVMAFPFFYALRERFPKAWIGVVAMPWVQSLQFSSLVNETIVISKRQNRSVFGAARWMFENARNIKDRGPWDLGVLLPNSFGAAALFRLGGVARIRGYATDARSFLLHESVAWDPDPNLHRADAYCKLLPGTSRAAFAQEIVTSFDPAKDWVRFDPVQAPHEKYFVVAPGATAESRRYSLDSFILLSKLITSRTGWKSVWVGGPSESYCIPKIEKELGATAINRIAVGPVPVLSSIFKNAEVSFTNESGLAHVAALCGSKVQIICGAANPKRTLPIGPGAVQLSTNPVPCWPCERNTCANSGVDYLACLKGISFDGVANQAQEGLLYGRF
jgi:heptosyltransferase II